MQQQKFWYFVVGGIFLLVVSNWFVWAEVNGSSFLKVAFFNVGQGDAIFIETPQGHQMLIDGGPDSKILEKLGRAMPFWDKSIDLVILTHPDQDHIGGLVDVLKRYTIETVLWTGVEKDTRVFKVWKETLEQEQKEGANVMIAKAPQKVTWSRDSSFSFLEILSPAQLKENIKKVNDTSIVSRLVFYNDSFLFTGDISKSMEQKLADSRIDLEADVLKVPHHGSKSSNTSAFLAAANPELAVIQVGKNRYGHPSQEVLKRLEGLRIPLLRTDQNGDIVIKSNGNGFQITTKNQ